MDEIINIQQNHNDGGSLLGKEGLMQLWKMINDNLSKAIDHTFVDNISSKLDSSKLTLTLPTYNLYTKAIRSVSTTIPAVSGSKAGLMTPTMLSTLNDLSKDFFTGVSKSGTDTVTLSFSTYNPSTKSTNTQNISFDVGSPDSATKDDLSQCVKKSIIDPTDEVIPIFDISLLPDNLLSFNSGSDNGTLLLIFNGSKNGETQEQVGYRARTTIPAVSNSKSGLMTPAMLSTLNNLSSGGGGPVSKDDVNKDFFTGVSKSGTNTVTLSFSTYNPSTKSTNTQNVSFDVGSDGVDLTTTDNRYIRKDTLNAQEMSGTLTAPAFYMTSDIALKRDIIDTPLPDKIASRMIQFKQFKYKQDDDIHYGVVAQEIEKILPQLVHENGGTKIVDYISLLCLKIQDLQDQINELKSKTSK